MKERKKKRLLEINIILELKIQSFLVINKKNLRKRRKLFIVIYIVNFRRNEKRKEIK